MHEGMARDGKSLGMGVYPDADCGYKRVEEKGREDEKERRGWEMMLFLKFLDTPLPTLLVVEGANLGHESNIVCCGV